MHDIFISYSHKDRPWVAKFSAALEKRGYKVWWDRDLVVSQDYASIIEDALNATKCVVTVWSSDSVKSKWVRAESARGFNQEMMLPVMIDDANIPIPYDTLHTADLRAWTGNENDPSFIYFTESLDWFLKGEKTPSKMLGTSAAATTASKPSAKPVNLKNPMVLAALALLVIVVGAIGYSFKSTETKLTETTLTPVVSPEVLACESGEQSIRKAAARGNKKRVQECINFGFDLSHQNEDGWTALHSAARNGQTEVLQFLITKSKPDDKEIKTNDGMTVLYLASHRLIEMLKKNKSETTKQEGGDELIKNLYDVIYHLKKIKASTDTMAKNQIDLETLVENSIQLKKILFGK